MHQFCEKHKTLLGSSQIIMNLRVRLGPVSRLVKTKMFTSLLRMLTFILINCESSFWGHNWIENIAVSSQSNYCGSQLKSRFKRDKEFAPITCFQRIWLKYFFLYKWDILQNLFCLGIIMNVKWLLLVLVVVNVSIYQNSSQFCDTNAYCNRLQEKHEAANCTM